MKTHPRREHWGACMTRVQPPHTPVTTAWPYPTMAGAIAALDPFQSAIHWPAHNVGAYLGRMGVGS